MTDAEARKLVTEWQDDWEELELDRATVDREIKSMEEKLTKYNIPLLGDMPTKRDDGSFQILVCQMGGCAITALSSSTYQPGCFWVSIDTRYADQ